MSTLVKGPWKSSTALPVQPVRRTHPLLLALLVALTVGTAGYVAYHVLTPVEPTPAVSVDLGPDHADGLTDGRYYPDETIRTGVWQTEVPDGKACGFTSQSRASGASDGMRSTPGTMTISVTSTNVWVAFTGGCTWYRTGR